MMIIKKEFPQNQDSELVPNRTCGRVPACPHLVVNLYRRQFSADSVVRAAYGQSWLRHRVLVSAHAGR